MSPRPRPRRLHPRLEVEDLGLGGAGGGQEVRVEQREDPVADLGELGLDLGAVGADGGGVRVVSPAFLLLDGNPIKTPASLRVVDPRGDEGQGLLRTSLSPAASVKPRAPRSRSPRGLREAACAALEVRRLAQARLTAEC